MALIQDIAGPSRQRLNIRRTGEVAAQKIAKFHQATIIPTPRMDMVKQPLRTRLRPGMITDISRMPGVSLPIAKPAYVPAPPPVPTKEHYKDFRPHPLLQKPPDSKPDVSGTKHSRTVPMSSPAAKQRIISDFMPGQRRSTQPAMAQQPTDATPTPQVSDQVARSTAPAQPKAIPSKPVRVRSKIFDFAQYPLIALAAVGIAYSPAAGQVAVGIYLLMALIFKVSSRVSFAIALVLLVCIPFFQVLGQATVSENVAVYAYEMLVVGTLQAIIELWRDNRRERRQQKSGSILPLQSGAIHKHVA